MNYTAKARLTNYGFNVLCAYIIKQAFEDLLRPKRKEEAKKFLFSEDCELMFDVIGLDKTIINRIDYENPHNSRLRDTDHQIFSKNNYKTF